MDRELPVRHLALRLRGLNRALQAAVQRRAKLAARLARPDLTHLCITDDEVHTLLRDADGLLEGEAAPPPATAASDADTGRAQEAALRASAAAAGLELPLDALARLHRLSPFEQQALLLCAAPEIDACYERIYGYVVDDMSRRNACVELLCAISSAALPERVEQLRALGPHGTLRRTGMLRAWGEPASDLRQELRLGAGMLDCLCGAGPPAAFFDPAEPLCAPVPVGAADAARVAQLGHGLRDRRIGIVGVVGPVRSGHAEVAQGLARAAGKPLRRLVRGADPAADIRTAIDAAAALDALLWIALDSQGDAPDGGFHEQLGAALARSSVPIVLTGTLAWRPVSLLAARTYAELRVAAPDYDARQLLWSDALPEADPAHLRELAGRYRVGAAEVQAAVLAAGGAAGLAGVASAAQHIDGACAAVLRPAGQRYVTLVEPRRGPDDLILAPGLHRQVMEVGGFFRAWPRVAGEWGFGRLAPARGGIKALFTGDSGTGKTLAAEVVAGELGMPLLKVDLAQIVSKWVGETEKHLDAVFAEAEDSHGLLFFDEADALFGKRGEVQHGVDRYANLEVSYLLQRIEDYAGLVILASNLKDNIDAAFTRRFQVSVHFPRPAPRERRRLWEMAFPKEVPLDHGLDLEVLTRLDLTGAGITSAARTAALLAAAEGCAGISARHVAQALIRQYQREARVLMPAELGPYAALAREAP